jgi:hypothetical protein
MAIWGLIVTGALVIGTLPLRRTRCRYAGARTFELASLSQGRNAVTRFTNATACQSGVGSGSTHRGGIAAAGIQFSNRFFSTKVTKQKVAECRMF